MREQLQRRLEQLRGELEEGEKMVAELDARKARLRETLLRISGAVQVLEEELEQVEEDAGSPEPERPPVADPVPAAVA